MGTLHALVSLPLQLSTIAQRHRINLRSRRQAVTRDALFFTRGNGFLGVASSDGLGGRLSLHRPLH